MELCVLTNVDGATWAAWGQAVVGAAAIGAGAWGINWQVKQQHRADRNRGKLVEIEKLDSILEMLRWARVRIQRASTIGSGEAAFKAASADEFFDSVSWERLAVVFERTAATTQSRASWSALLMEAADAVLSAKSSAENVNIYVTSGLLGSAVLGGSAALFERVAMDLQAIEGNFSSKAQDIKQTLE